MVDHRNVCQGTKAILQISSTSALRHRGASRTLILYECSKEKYRTGNYDEESQAQSRSSFKTPLPNPESTIETPREGTVGRFEDKGSPRPSTRPQQSFQETHIIDIHTEVRRGRRGQNTPSRTQRQRGRRRQQVGQLKEQIQKPGCCRTNQTPRHMCHFLPSLADLDVHDCSPTQ